jgi:hypothetical protein
MQFKEGCREQDSLEVREQGRKLAHV